MWLTVVVHVLREHRIELLILGTEPALGTCHVPYIIQTKLLQMHIIAKISADC